MVVNGRLVENLLEVGSLPAVISSLSERILAWSKRVPLKPWGFQLKRYARTGAALWVIQVSILPCNQGMLQQTSRQHTPGADEELPY